MYICFWARTHITKYKEVTNCTRSLKNCVCHGRKLDDVAKYLSFGVFVFVLLCSATCYSTGGFLFDAIVVEASATRFLCSCPCWPAPFLAIGWFLSWDRFEDLEGGKSFCKQLLGAVAPILHYCGSLQSNKGCPVPNACKRNGQD